MKSFKPTVLTGCLSILALTSAEDHHSPQKFLKERLRVAPSSIQKLR